jgi:hypothetical protein
MAKKSTTKNQAVDIMKIANDKIKSLKEEVSKLKRSNAAYKGINKSLHESTNDLQKDYNAIIKEKEMFKNIDNKSLNSVIEKQKAELSELKEKNAMQTKVIEEKEARIKQLMDSIDNSRNTKSIMDSHVTQGLKHLIDVTGIEPALDEKIHRLACDTEEMWLLKVLMDCIVRLDAKRNPSGAIKESREKYNLLEAKYNNLINSYNELNFENTKLKSYATEPIAFPLYINLCDAMGEHHGIKAEELIKKVKALKDDNFKLETNNNGYKTLYNNLKSLLNLEGSTITIGTAIKKLQADLEAARKQEDINSKALSEIENILEKTMGVFQLEEIEKVILKLKKPKVKINLKFKDVNLTDIIDDLAKKMSQEKFKKEYLAEDWPKESINIIGIKMPSGFHDGQTVTIHFK